MPCTKEEKKMTHYIESKLEMLQGFAWRKEESIQSKVLGSVCRDSQIAKGGKL